MIAAPAHVSLDGGAGEAATVNMDAAAESSAAMTPAHIRPAQSRCFKSMIHDRPFRATS
jgi:hypothetical protein